MQIEIKVISGKTVGKCFSFKEPDCFLFGRSTDARISLPGDPYVSRHHFLLEIAPPECKITDLDSKNGTFVNNVRYGGRRAPGPGWEVAPENLLSVYLQNNDTITVGDTILKVRIEIDAYCADCNARVAVDMLEKSVIVDGTYLCEACRQQEDMTKHHETSLETLTTIPKNEDPAVPVKLLHELLKAADLESSMPGPLSIEGYTINDELGRGGMGVVYKAIDQETGKTVAIKTMLPQVATSENSARIFMREVEVTRQLMHKNIVELYDQGNAQGIFYFVIEFVEGMDLEQFIRSKGGHVRLDQAVPIMLGITEGLAYAHRANLTMQIAGGKQKRFTGIVHRDLKPQNILLSKNGNQWIPKIADFGLSKSFESAGLTDMTIPGQIAGTPIYWPREQITHYKFLSPATDVFSIAAVFYEALTGSRVRQGYKKMFERCASRKQAPGISDYMRVIAHNPTLPIRNRLDRIPKPVAEVIDRALREDEIPANVSKMRTTLAELRYPDAGAFQQALIKALEKSGIQI